MRATTLRWLNWSGWAFLLLWLIGFVFFAHVVPPPSPNENAEEITDTGTHTDAPGDGNGNGDDDGDDALVDAPMNALKGAP